MKKQNRKLLELLEHNGNKAKLKQSTALFNVACILEHLTAYQGALDEKFYNLLTAMCQHVNKLMSCPLLGNYDIEDMYVIIEVEQIENNNK